MRYLFLFILLLPSLCKAQSNRLVTFDFANLPKVNEEVLYYQKARYQGYTPFFTTANGGGYEIIPIYNLLTGSGSIVEANGHFVRTLKYP